MDGPAARRLLAVALVLGLAAEILVHGPAAGINALLLVAATLGGAWLLRRRGRRPDPWDAWLPLSALVLAGFVAIRADPFVAILDILGAAALTGASMAAFSGLAVTRRSASVVLTMAAYVVEASVGGTARMLQRARPPRRDTPRRAPAWLAGVGRGLVLAIPLVLIFAVLFASADPIFRRALDDVLGLRIDLGDLPGRVLFVVAVAWFIAGLLSIAAVGIPDLERASLGAAARTAAVPGVGRVLGPTEALVVLVGVDLVVASFVGLQVAYLFGGLDTLAAAGMTYADYARRGYFELVGAAALAGALLATLEITIVRRPRAYVALALALVGLTVIVLASAALRLGLYQAAYGWTELRLYVAVSIVAMAVTLGVLAVLLATDRTRWLGHGMAAIALVSLIGLNVIAPAAFVAERNLDRVLDPSLVPVDGHTGLDVAYLEVLPDDAVPALVEALPALPEPEASLITDGLLRRRQALATDPALTSPAAWNLGRERARAALSTLP